MKILYFSLALFTSVYSMNQEYHKAISNETEINEMVVINLESAPAVTKSSSFDKNSRIKVALIAGSSAIVSASITAGIALIISYNNNKC